MQRVDRVAGQCDTVGLLASSQAHVVGREERAAEGRGHHAVLVTVALLVLVCRVGVVVAAAHAAALFQLADGSQVEFGAVQLVYDAPETSLVLTDRKKRMQCSFGLINAFCARSDLQEGDKSGKLPTSAENSKVLNDLKMLGEGRINTPFSIPCASAPKFF